MKKVVVEECKHPEGKSFKEPREDGSGKWDLICGVCGFTMCEIGNPLESAASVVAEAKLGAVERYCGAWECEFNTGKDLGTEADGQGCNKHEEGDLPGLCESWRPLDKDIIAEVGPCINTDCPDNSKQGCGKNVLECDDYIEVSAHVCTTESCANYGQELDGSNCMKLGGADMLDCVDFTTSREAVIPALDAAAGEDQGVVVDAATAHEGDPCVHCGVAHDDVPPGPCGARITSPFTSDGNQPKSYVSREPDKIGGRFQELLPVPVDDHELGQYGIELAEQTSLWRRTKLDAKKFAKAAKEVTDKCEERMIELEEIIQDHARMDSIDVQWEYDFTEGVKRLRRCDTWEIVREETLTAEERQPSFDFGASQAAVNKLAEVQAGGGAPLQGETVEDTPLTDDPPEGCSKCEGAGYYIEDDPDKKGGEVFCDCEAGKLLEKQAGFPETTHVEIEEVVAPGEDESLPVIDIDAKVDEERRCCMPSDRAQIVEGDVVVSYCRVCHLILKKTPVGGDPWDSIDFVYGEKVSLEEPGAQA